MKYIALEELQKYIIHDGCDEGCGYIDERDIAAIPTVDLDKIRSEIAEESKGTMNENRAEGLYKALQIIDKYREQQAERSEE